MVIIIMALGALLFLYLIKRVYTKNWMKGVEASLHLSSNEAYPGDRLTLTEVIINGKWLPLPMIKVKFEIDKSLVFDDIVGNTKLSDMCYKSDVFSVLFYQKITRRLDFTCTKRGYFTIDSMDVVSTDVLMDSVLAHVFDVNESITCFPEPVSPDDVDIPYKRLMGTILTKRFAYEDPFEFRGIREYQQYDSMKDVNWSASAKTGELKVNVHNYTSGQQVVLLLNVETEGAISQDDLKEKSISMASSLAYMLIEQGVMVSLVTNGRDKMSGETNFVAAGCDMNHFDNINRVLARIDLKKEAPGFAEYLEKVRSSKEIFSQDSIPVMISYSQREDLKEVFGKINSEVEEAMWLIPNKEGWVIK